MSNKSVLVLLASCLLAIAPGCGNKQAGFSLSAVSSMIKIPMRPDKPVAQTDTAKISAAGGEYESFQVMITPADTIALNGVRWKISALRGESGTIDTSNITVNPVGYVQTTATMRNYPSALGWWPDPLLRLDTLSVPARERQPLWVTVYVPPGTAKGTYRGEVTVTAGQSGSVSLPVELRVWGFDIPVRPSIKTLCWVNRQQNEAFGIDTQEKRKAYYEMLLKHRLGPGGRILEQDEDLLGFCMDRGMNAILLESVPNLRRLKLKSFSKGYKDSLTAKLSHYAKEFGPKGWLDGFAYVYNYDEVDRKHWPDAKMMYKLIKSVSPEFRVIQCLNIPAGVAALAGYADTWDVYVAQFEKSGVKKRVEAGDEAWLAVCCYPVNHPNFFLEYPAIDVRLVGWICFRTGVTGFEYWSPNHWNGNDSPPKLRGGWKANTFLRYNGDGYLTYPVSDGGPPISSVRLENLRDGFEDYEYLHMLKELGGDVKLDQSIVASPAVFSSDTERLYDVRAEIAGKIEELKAGK